jgi:hypothetical protein
MLRAEARSAAKPPLNRSFAPSTKSLMFVTLGTNTAARSRSRSHREAGTMSFQSALDLVQPRGQSCSPERSRSLGSWSSTSHQHHQSARTWRAAFGSIPWCSRDGGRRLDRSAMHREIRRLSDVRELPMWQEELAPAAWRGVGLPPCGVPPSRHAGCRAAVPPRAPGARSRVSPVLAQAVSGARSPRI